MKVNSMTGFGEGEAFTAFGQIKVEIKSVNNRYKDIRCRVPSKFTSIEMDLRKIINTHFKRGTFDISVTYRKDKTVGLIDDIDSNKVNTYLADLKAITDKAGATLTISPADLLKEQFLRDSEDKEVDEVKSSILKACSLAALQLKSCREEEGEKLIEIIEDNINRYGEKVVVVKSASGKFEDITKARILERAEKHLGGIELDESRFLQEIVYYLEKMDIGEEVDRIGVHLDKLKKVLGDGGEVGRRMDFLVQELNRESNTIGSKSSISEISESVVQMKVHLEKIREQALNIE